MTAQREDGASAGAVIVSPAEYHGFTEVGACFGLGHGLRGPLWLWASYPDQELSSPHSELLPSVVSALSLI